MLEFFRKHQKYFFAVITVVIIISFSFFGTYDTLPGNAIHEQVAFTAIDGTQIKRHELDSVVYFLSTDNEDKRLFGGVWGPNFLNDGVIKKDVLATGLAEMLVKAYPEALSDELQIRLEKEKRYSPYAHPQAKFISAEGAWNYFAPQMKTYYDAMRRANDATSSEAFAARVALYLNERRFPAPLLRQVLQYQQKQYAWLTPDPNLDHLDLSLFGYHTMEDWFGARFMRMMAEFIINSSMLAEQKGYQVTKEEALADLMRNAEISYHQNGRNPHLGVANSNEYFKEQLRILNIDQTRATRIWQQVLLFRRLFHDVGNAVITDTLLPQKFYAFSKETAVGDLYHLPEELHFGNSREMHKFELYLYAVAKRPRFDKMNDQEMLAVPSTFLAVDEVKKKYPELVQKRYVLELAQVKKSALNSKVGLKETWNWEVEDANWQRLKKEFPVLGAKKADTREERFAVLDGVDDRTRVKIDAFAREEIVDSHPEWLEKALNEAEAKEEAVGISSKGGNSIVIGLENRQELMQLLDKAPLKGEEPKSSAAKEAAAKLMHFSGDEVHYYRIRVIERNPQEEILSFAEANQQGIVDQILDKQLETHYVKMRDSAPSEFKKDDGTWRAFAEVKDKVSNNYFEKLVKAIQNNYVAATGDKTVASMTSDRAASLRFYALARDLKAQLEQGQGKEAIVVEEEEDAPRAFADQFKIGKSSFKASRSSEEQLLNVGEMLSLNTDQWTQVNAPVNGDLYFMQVKGKENGDEIAAVFEKTNDAHHLLSNDAQRIFMHEVIGILKAKKAISLDYLDRASEDSMDKAADKEE